MDKIYLENGKKFDYKTFINEELKSDVMGVTGRSGVAGVLDVLPGTRQDLLIGIRHRETGIEKKFDMYQYLEDKGFKVDKQKTFDVEQERVKAESEAARKAKVEKEMKQMETELGADFSGYKDRSIIDLSGFGKDKTKIKQTADQARKMLAGSMFPYTRTLVESGEYSAPREAIAFNMDLLSMISLKAPIAAADDMMYKISKGEHGMPAILSMAQAPQYGADTKEDGTKESLSDHFATLRDAMRWDPMGVMTDLARESGRDVLTGATIAAIAASPFTGGATVGTRMAMVVKTVAKMYSKGKKTEGLVKKAGAMARVASIVKKTSEKVEAMGVVNKAIAKTTWGVGLESVGGAVQGFLGILAMGGDPSRDDVLIEAAEEGAFGMALSVVTGIPRAVIYKMSPSEQTVLAKEYYDKIDKLQAKIDQGADMSTLTPEEAAILPFTAYGIAISERAKKTKNSQFIPTSEGTVIEDGTTVPYDQPLPNNVDENEFKKKVNNPGWSGGPSVKEAEGDLQKRRTAASTAIKEQAKNEKAFDASIEKDLEKINTEAVAEADKEIEEREKALQEKAKERQDIIQKVTDIKKDVDFDEFSKAFGQEGQSSEDLVSNFANYQMAKENARRFEAQLNENKKQSAENRKALIEAGKVEKRKKKLISEKEELKMNPADEGFRAAWERVRKHMVKVAENKAATEAKRTGGRKKPAKKPSDEKVSQALQKGYTIPAEYEGLSTPDNSLKLQLEAMQKEDFRTGESYNSMENIVPAMIKAKDLPMEFTHQGKYFKRVRDDKNSQGAPPRVVDINGAKYDFENEDTVFIDPEFGPELVPNIGEELSIDDSNADFYARLYRDNPELTNAIRQKQVEMADAARAAEMEAYEDPGRISRKELLKRADEAIDNVDSPAPIPPVLGQNTAVVTDGGVLVTGEFQGTAKNGKWLIKKPGQVKAGQYGVAARLERQVSRDKKFGLAEGTEAGIQSTFDQSFEKAAEVVWGDVAPEVIADYTAYKEESSPSTLQQVFWVKENAPDVYAEMMTRFDKSPVSAVDELKIADSDIIAVEPYFSEDPDVVVSTDENVRAEQRTEDVAQDVSEVSPLMKVLEKKEGRTEAENNALGVMKILHKERMSINEQLLDRGKKREQLKKHNQAVQDLVARVGKAGDMRAAKLTDHKNAVQESEKAGETFPPNPPSVLAEEKVRSTALEQIIDLNEKIDKLDKELVEMEDLDIMDANNQYAFKILKMSEQQGYKSYKTGVMGTRPELYSKNVSSEKWRKRLADIGKYDMRAAQLDLMIMSSFPNLAINSVEMADMAAKLAWGNNVPADIKAAKNMAHRWTEGQAGKLDAAIFKEAFKYGAFTMATGSPLGGAVVHAGFSFLNKYHTRVAYSSFGKYGFHSVRAQLSEKRAFQRMLPKIDQAWLLKNKRINTFTDKYNSSVKGLKDEELVLMRDYIEGVIKKPEDLDFKIIEAGEKVRAINIEIKGMLNDAGWKFADNENYFTHALDWGRVQAMKADPVQLERQVQHLIENAEMDRETAAATLVSYYDNSAEMKQTKSKKARKDFYDACLEKSGSNPKKFAHTLAVQKSRMTESVIGSISYGRTAPRLTSDMYVSDVNAVMHDYITGTMQAITYREKFGKGLIELNQALLSSYGKTATYTTKEGETATRQTGVLTEDGERFKSYLEAELYNRSITMSQWGEQVVNSKAIAGLVRYQFISKLMTSLLAPGRNIITAWIMSNALHGFGATNLGLLRTFAQIVKGEGFRQAHLAGAITDQTMTEVTGTELMTKNLLDKAIEKIHPFTYSEKIVRSMAYNAGLISARRMFKQMQAGGKAGIKARERLTYYLGEEKIINDLADGVMSQESQQLMAAQCASDVGGHARVMNLSPFFSTSEGKLLMQYRRIAFHQSVVFKDRIFLPATRGEFGPIIRWGISVGIGGYVAGMMGMAVYGEKEQEDFEDLSTYGQQAWRILEYINQTNALALYGDYGSAYEHGIFGQTPMVGTFTGPTLSTLLNGYSQLHQVIAEGKDPLQAVVDMTLQEGPGLRQVISIIEKK